MSATPNLGLTYLTSGQLQPEVTVNGDLNLLDGVMAAPAAFANNPATTSGLTYGYYGGYLWSGATEVQVAAGTLTLTASTTNYIQMTTSGVVSANANGFTSGQIPLAKVVTSASNITSIADMRPYSLGIGGSGGAAASVTFQSTAVGNITSNTLVSTTSGGVKNPSLTTVSDVAAIVGIAYTSANNGGALTVMTAGQITESAWTWAPGPIYAGTSGVLTQTLPTSGASVVVAQALSATTIQVGIEPALML